jgi:uncharacterized membrane protein (DUF485 family)
MWALIKSLLTQWALFKILLKSLGSLAWLLPIAFLLKFIGLPALIILAIVAAPLIIILLIVGLPMAFVAVAGAVILAGIFFLLSLGIAVLKIAIPIFIVYWLLKWAFGSRKTGDGTVEG